MSQDQHAEYTHPDVFTIGVQEGWAEAETDPTRINWHERRAPAIPFQVIDGRPVNPCEKTRVRHGRNEMGWWGENLMADALVAVRRRRRYLLMIERDDGYGWGVPGGRVEPGEAPLHAAVRELEEETGLAVIGDWRAETARRFVADPEESGPSIAGDWCREMTPRYVPDPRASDEAWAVTVPVHFDLGARTAREPLPRVAGGSDARRAEWVPAGTCEELAAAVASLYGGKVFAAHVAMLRDFLGTAEGRR